MIKVEQTAKTIDEGIKNMMIGAKKDYERFHTSNGRKEIVSGSYGDTELKNYESKIKISQGKKYIKVLTENRVFAFIVKEDFKHFKKGDVLKPAGYNAPALNQPRGNVLTGNYPIQWTGPLYLK
jgi:riboflavin synthase